MKIWEARLNLIGVDITEYELNFNFKMCDEEYKENKKFNEWIYSEGWICNRVPMEMTASTSYGNISVIQGFDHKLTENELKDVEMNMRRFIREKLEDDMEVYKRQYEKKISTIEGQVWRKMID